MFLYESCLTIFTEMQTLLGESDLDEALAISFANSSTNTQAGCTAAIKKKVKIEVEEAVSFSINPAAAAGLIYSAC